jgi:hypothetical protein
VVFSYSFIDSVVSKLLLEEFNISKSNLKDFKHLRMKVGSLDSRNPKVRTIEAYDAFWEGIEWLRNELVHPKRRDHSAALELDKLDLADRVNRLNICGPCV